MKKVETNPNPVPEGQTPNQVQLYTKKANADEIVDILTGEKLSANDPVKLSEAKARINLRRRELEKQEDWIDDKLYPLVMEAFNAGADTFCNFWKIQKGSTRFNEKSFYAKASADDIAQYEQAKDLIKSLTDRPEYYKASDPSLRYPKN